MDTLSTTDRRTVVVRDMHGTARVGLASAPTDGGGGFIRFEDWTAGSRGNVLCVMPGSVLAIGENAPYGGEMAALHAFLQRKQG
jgi:hypothetical protein